LHGPARGGVTSALIEIVPTAIVGILLGQASIPISEEVNGAYEIPELDPPYIVDEGKLLAIIASEDVELPLQNAEFAFVRQGCYFVALHADPTIAQRGSSSRE
jgi:hydrogenase maturation factor